MRFLKRLSRGVHPCGMRTRLVFAITRLLSMTRRPARWNAGTSGASSSFVTRQWEKRWVGRRDGTPVEKAVLDVVAKLELPFSPLRRSSAVPSSRRATICPIDIYRTLSEGGAKAFNAALLLQPHRSHTTSASSFLSLSLSLSFVHDFYYITMPRVLQVLLLFLANHEVARLSVPCRVNWLTKPCTYVLYVHLSYPGSSDHSVISTELPIVRSTFCELS